MQSVSEMSKFLRVDQHGKDVNTVTRSIHRTDAHAPDQRVVALFSDDRSESVAEWSWKAPRYSSQRLENRSHPEQQAVQTARSGRRRLVYSIAACPNHRRYLGARRAEDVEWRRASSQHTTCSRQELGPKIPLQDVDAR